MGIEKKSMTPRNLLSIDPSINYCGVAVWNIHKKELIEAALIKPSKIVKRDGEYYDKAFSVYTQIGDIIRKQQCVAVACELPDYWSVAGFMARESGSLTKLVFVCGLIYGYRLDVERFVFALPRQWKGQLSKDVMKVRLTKEYAGEGKFYTEEQWTKLDPNICDAIGIGHWSLFGRV